MNTLVHLILNAVRRFSDVAHRLCVYAALSNQPISFKLIDSAPLNFLLQGEIVPICA